MKEPNRHRLERLLARYTRRRQEQVAPDDDALVAAFVQHRASVLHPAMTEFAEALRGAGHEALVVEDDHAGYPAVELRVGLVGASPERRNAVGFRVLRFRPELPLQVLAYLEGTLSPFDINRFDAVDQLTANRVEQLLVDALEHLIVTSAP